MALCSYGRCSYGLRDHGICSYGLCGYALCSVGDRLCGHRLELRCARWCEHVDSVGTSTASLFRSMPTAERRRTATHQEGGIGNGLRRGGAFRVPSDRHRPSAPLGYLQIDRPSAPLGYLRIDTGPRRSLLARARGLSLKKTRSATATRQGPVELRAAISARGSSDGISAAVSVSVSRNAQTRLRKARLGTSPNVVMAYVVMARLGTSPM